MNTRRALRGHSGTPALKDTWTLKGHLGMDLDTSTALERHSKCTRALESLRHSSLNGTWPLGHSVHSDTWELSHFGTKGTWVLEALYLADLKYQWETSVLCFRSSSNFLYI